MLSGLFLSLQSRKHLDNNLNLWESLTFHLYSLTASSFRERGGQGAGIIYFPETHTNWPQGQEVLPMSLRSHFTSDPCPARSPRIKYVVATQKKKKKRNWTKSVKTWGIQDSLKCCWCEHKNSTFLSCFICFSPSDKHCRLFCHFSGHQWAVSASPTTIKFLVWLQEVQEKPICKKLI